MEIERKYLIKQLPENLEDYEHKEFEQGYLSIDPVVRVRNEGGSYFLTYKSGGMMARLEYNLPLNEASYSHLAAKADNNLINKTRYFIPYTYEGAGRTFTIELDIFHGKMSGLIMAEVEFETIEESEVFTPPVWFETEVTYDPDYHNSKLSRMTYEELLSRSTQIGLNR